MNNVKKLLAALAKTQKERDKKNRQFLAAFNSAVRFGTAKPYSLTELEEDMKARPALRDINRILGTSATAAQKMELFKLMQKFAEAAIQRTIRDMTQW